MKHSATAMEPFERGVLLGLLVGEGHFGGDGRQPHVTLRMHTRHQPMLERLIQWIPGSKLYGPYTHGGRDYVQWMARGPALQTLLSELQNMPISVAELDPHVGSRFAKMLETYRLVSAPTG